MSYTHADGSPDSPEDILTCSRVFAVALGVMLRESEGIVIELPYQNNDPNAAHGYFMIYSDRELVKCNKMSPDEIEVDKVPYLVWVHNEALQ